MDNDPVLISREIHRLRYVRIPRSDFDDMRAGMVRLGRLDRKPLPFQGFRHTRIECYIEDLECRIKSFGDPAYDWVKLSDLEKLRSVNRHQEAELSDIYLLLQEHGHQEAQARIISLRMDLNLAKMEISDLRKQLRAREVKDV